MLIAFGALCWVGCAQVFGIDSANEVPAPDASGEDATSRSSVDGGHVEGGGGQDSQGPADEAGESGSGGNDASADDAMSADASMDSTMGTDGALDGEIGGDASVDGGTGDGGTPADSGTDARVCSMGATQCSGNAAVETCGADGTWGTPTSCTNQACVGGMCSGMCSPFTTQCSGNAVQTCSGQGQWGSAVACPTVAPTCTAGACFCPTGSMVSNGICCPNGQTGCSGACVDEQTSASNCNGCGVVCPYGLCQSAMCAASFFGAGFPNPGGFPTVSIGPDTLLGEEVHSGATSTVVAIGVDTIEVGVQLRLGLYSDNAGTPGSLVAQTGDLTSVANGRTEGLVTVTAPVTAGAAYWVMILANSNIQLATQSTLAAWHYQTGTTYGPLPPTFTGTASVSQRLGDLYFVTAP